MVYLLANHTETYPFMPNLENFTWTSSRQDTGISDTYADIYTSGDWTVNVTYPFLISNPTYSIIANFTAGKSTVFWVGTCQNGKVAEEAYSSTSLLADLPAQERVRDTIMSYIKAYHEEAGGYMQPIAWAGGRTTPPGTVGSETYLYQGSGWNLELQYPVVPNTVYTVSANYTGRGMTNIIAWQGTLQNGIIIETSYAHTT
jgi:hypothetical protein